MNWIFWGMACMLLDIDVTLGGRTIGLVPDWLGWWWLAKGCTELETEWEGFRRSSIPKLMAGLALLLHGFETREPNFPEISAAVRHSIIVPSM